MSAIVAVGLWIGSVQASFDADPADSDHQRGYRAAVDELRRVYDAAIAHQALIDGRFERFTRRVAGWSDDELAVVCPRQTRHVAQVVIDGADPIYPRFAPTTPAHQFDPPTSAGDAQPRAALMQEYRSAARGYGRAGTAEMVDGPYMSMADAAGVFADLISARKHEPSSADMAGSGPFTVDGGANSHVFEQKIMRGGECIAFADEPWASHIARTLAVSPVEALTSVVAAAQAVLDDIDDCRSARASVATLRAALRSVDRLAATLTDSGTADTHAGSVREAVKAGTAVLEGRGDGTYDEAQNAIRSLIAALHTVVSPAPAGKA